MKTLELYQVDAFAPEPFTGNPAAVCILDTWLPDSLMQAIAAENNLAETAFAVPQADGYAIRWFTPAVEVALCGHATLATAHVLFQTRETATSEITFHSRERGPLTVSRDAEWLVLDFPADVPAEAALPEGLAAAMGAEPQACLKGLTDYMLVYHNQAAIDALDPNFFALKSFQVRGIIATAPGEAVDFVSRFFAPAAGIDEDPVTGSAHTMLIPYWADRLGKTTLSAQQRSPRGGMLRYAYNSPRVHIGGQAITYLKGEIYLPNL
ncbi:PhzF family phenazine biosynthesis protein [Robiginitalea sp. M366]|uniref:PhzF family phenazine biosynthesis protein n=1 Tax=Robiginitalea aestuariiviva TaxID=3036903 RepID=UPI00240D590D|nr:PhzF family phenazine biosynthesis protein [Robiginitalea aestuariiviva]MDG1571376.1 PhzF family phenazine biosynthesis protein [Robiginitalea aestuariiviva]